MDMQQLLQQLYQQYQSQQHEEAGDEQFKDFNASQLYCPKCKQAQPVTKRLLLVLPDGELYEYKCRVCGESLGKQKDTSSQPVQLVL